MYYKWEKCWEYTFIRNKKVDYEYTFGLEVVSFLFVGRVQVSLVIGDVSLDKFFFEKSINSFILKYSPIYTNLNRFLPVRIFKRGPDVS